MFNRSIYTKAFLGLLTANMFFWMSVNFFMPVLPIYYHSLGMDDHQVGLAIGAFSIGAVLFRIFSGKAVDRYGSRPVITVGIFLSVAAISCYYFSDTLASATLSRFLHGVGISGYSAAALTMATLMQEEQDITEAVAVYTLFTMLGIGAAASTANWLFNIGQMPLVIAAGIITTILSLLLFPKKVRLKIKPVASEKVPFREVATNPAVFIPTVSLFAVNLCFGSIMTFLPLLMLSRGVTEYNSYYVAYAVAVIFSRFWVGKLCDLLTPRRLSLYILLILGGTLLLTGESASGSILVLCGLSIGVGYGLAFPTLATIITANTVPANRGTAFGVYTTAVDIGIAVGSIGMGAVASMWGYNAVFLTAGIYTIAYAVFYRWWLYHKINATAACSSSV